MTSGWMVVGVLATLLAHGSASSGTVGEAPSWLVLEITNGTSVSIETLNTCDGNSPCFFQVIAKGKRLYRGYQHSWVSQDARVHFNVGDASYEMRHDLTESGDFPFDYTMALGGLGPRVHVIVMATSPEGIRAWNVTPPNALVSAFSGASIGLATPKDFERGPSATASGLSVGAAAGVAYRKALFAEEGFFGYFKPVPGLLDMTVSARVESPAGDHGSCTTGVHEANLLCNEPVPLTGPSGDWLFEILGRERLGFFEDWDDVLLTWVDAPFSELADGKA